jgi:hypothetical protein
MDLPRPRTIGALRIRVPLLSDVLIGFFMALMLFSANTAVTRSRFGVFFQMLGHPKLGNPE